MVGFGSVDKAHEKPGTRLSVEWSVEGERGKVGATVVRIPFFDPERKRSVTGSPHLASRPNADPLGQWVTHG